MEEVQKKENLPEKKKIVWWQVAIMIVAGLVLTAALMLVMDAMLVGVIGIVAFAIFSIWIEYCCKGREFAVRKASLILNIRIFFLTVLVAAVVSQILGIEIELEF